MLKINYFILSFLILLTACSQGKETESRFVLSLSALSAGMTFNGGGILQLKHVDTGVVTTYELTTSNVVKLPHGKWHMFFVGFEGTAPWSGPFKCGSVNDVVLSLPSQIVDIVVDASCALSPYNSIINSKAPAPEVGKWNQGKWGEAKWGP